MRPAHWPPLCRSPLLVHRPALCPAALTSSSPPTLVQSQRPFLASRWLLRWPTGTTSSSTGRAPRGEAAAPPSLAGATQRTAAARASTATRCWPTAHPPPRPGPTPGAARGLLWYWTWELPRPRARLSSPLGLSRQTVVSPSTSPTILLFGRLLLRLRRLQYHLHHRPCRHLHHRPCRHLPLQCPPLRPLPLRPLLRPRHPLSPARGRVAPHLVGPTRLPTGARAPAGRALGASVAAVGRSSGAAPRPFARLLGRGCVRWRSSRPTRHARLAAPSTPSGSGLPTSAAPPATRVASAHPLRGSDPCVGQRPREGWPMCAAVRTFLTRLATSP